MTLQKAAEAASSAADAAAHARNVAAACQQVTQDTAQCLLLTKTAELHAVQLLQQKNTNAAAVDVLKVARCLGFYHN